MRSKLGFRVSYLQHVQQSRLAGIVETEEKELGVLVEQTKAREDVVDCDGTQVS